jgi:hypothetical protein
MTEVDLDFLIRSIARKQIKTLIVAAKQRRGHLMGKAARATDKDNKARYKHLAKVTMEHAGAAARRLQMSANNTADAYSRAMAKAAEEARAIQSAKAAARKAARKKS